MKVELVEELKLVSPIDESSTDQDWFDCINEFCEVSMFLEQCSMNHLISISPQMIEFTVPSQEIEMSYGYTHVLVNNILNVYFDIIVDTSLTTLFVSKAQ